MEYSKENPNRNTTKILNSTKENSYNNSSFELYNNKSSVQDINYIPDSTLKDKPNFLQLSKYIKFNDINFVDRRSLRNIHDKIFSNNNIRKIKEIFTPFEKEEILPITDHNFLTKKAIEKENLNLLNDSDQRGNLDKKLQQHRFQKLIESGLKKYPNDKKIFEFVINKKGSTNLIKRANSIFNKNSVPPESLKRLMSISPYSTISNSIKFSWINEVKSSTSYQPNLRGSLMDQEGNRVKHVSHGSSTVFSKHNHEKNEMLVNLLDNNIDLPVSFKKAVKLKNIRRIIKLKTRKFRIINHNLIFHL